MDDFDNLNLLRCVSSPTEKTIEDIQNGATAVNFGSKCIPNNEAEMLAETLAKTPNAVTRLCMLQNDVAATGAAALGEMLAKNSTLKCLELSRNRLGDSGVCALAQALRYNSSLKVLHVADNGVGSKGVQSLVEMLRVNRCLVELDIGSNQPGHDDVIELLRAAVVENGVLKKLGLALTVPIWSALVNVMKINKSLTALDLRLNGLSDDGAVVLANWLATDTALKSIDLGHNSLFVGGMIALSNALMTNSTLTSLNLEGNNLSSVEGLESLGILLHINSSLRVLSLSNCGIGQEGAQVLADVLKDNCYLSKLDLSENLVGFEGIKALSCGLKHNSRLKSLNLSRNNIISSGMKVLASGLASNLSLKVLMLSFNDIGGWGGAKYVAKMLQNNSCLTEVRLRHCIINGAESEQEILLSGLKCNGSILKLDLGYEDRKIDGLCRRNRSILDQAKKNVLLLLLARQGDKGCSLWILPKDVVRLIAKLVWMSRREIATWWHDST